VNDIECCGRVPPFSDYKYATESRCIYVYELAKKNAMHPKIQLTHHSTMQARQMCAINDWINSIGSGG